MYLIQWIENLARNKCRIRRTMVVFTLCVRIANIVLTVHLIGSRYDDRFTDGAGGRPETPSARRTGQECISGRGKLQF